MTKFEQMITVLEKINEDLKTEVQKAYECDSDLQDNLETARELTSQAASCLKGARKRIAQIKNQAVLVKEQFPDEQ